MSSTVVFSFRYISNNPPQPAILVAADRLYVEPGDQKEVLTPRRELWLGNISDMDFANKINGLEYVNPENIPKSMILPNGSGVITFSGDRQYRRFVMNAISSIPRELNPDALKRKIASGIVSAENAIIEAYSSIKWFQEYEREFRQMIRSRGTGAVMLCLCSEMNLISVRPHYDATLLCAKYIPTEREFPYDVNSCFTRNDDLFVAGLKNVTEAVRDKMELMMELIKGDQPPISLPSLRALMPKIIKCAKDASPKTIGTQFDAFCITHHNVCDIMKENWYVIMWKSIVACFIFLKKIPNNTKILENKQNL